MENHPQNQNKLHHGRISPVAPSSGYDSDRHLSTVAVVKPTQQQQLQEQNANRYYSTVSQNRFE